MRPDSPGQRNAVTVHVNGETKNVRAGTVRELLLELGHDPERSGIAVAVDDEVVPRGQWNERRLHARDRVEIVGAVQGG